MSPFTTSVGPLMNQLQAMRIFLRVVDQNSFHLAARQLGISAAAVTRSVSTLEAHLNARLLNRSTRSLSLTEVGRDYVEGCRAILSHVDTVESELMRTTHDPVGSLRIAAPTAFAVAGLSALLQAYRIKHPRVEFDLTPYDARIDLIEGGFDLAFSVDRQLGNSSLVSRQLSYVKEIIVAAPDYLARKGIPRTPNELARHDLLTVSDGSPRLWEFASGSTSVRITPHGTLSATSCTMVRAATLQGMGVAMLPAHLVAEDLERGALVSVLSNYQVNGGPQRLSLLYPSRSYLSTKARSFIDFVVSHYRTPVLHAVPTSGDAREVGPTTVESAAETAREGAPSPSDAKAATASASTGMVAAQSATLSHKHANKHVSIGGATQKASFRQVSVANIR